MANMPVVHIDYIYSRSQCAIMYLDKLRNTNADCCRNLQLAQFIFFLCWSYDDCGKWIHH